MRMLVVEDDASLRALVCDIIQLRGHEPVGVGDAEAALDAYRAQPFPLLLIDLTLPGVDGLELCQRIRQEPIDDDPVIMVITGREKHGAVQDALRAGTDDFVSKPIDLE